MNSIDCPWCGVTQYLDPCDISVDDCSEVNCADCGKPFHFGSELRIVVGDAYKTLGVVKCECPSCGYDDRKSVRANDSGYYKLCPACRKPVLFVVERESE